MITGSSPLFTDGREKYPVRTAALLCLLFIIITALAVVIPILIQSNSLYSVELLYDYRPGELANEDVIAPYDFSFDDEIATQAAREENARRVLPQFDFSMTQTYSSVNRAKVLADALMDEDSDVAALATEYGISEPEAFATAWSLISQEDKAVVLQIFQETLEYFLHQGIFQQSQLNDITAQGYTLVQSALPADDSYELVNSMAYVSGVVSDDSLNEAVIDYLDNYTVILPASSFSILMRLIDAFDIPNVLYDELETERLRTEAREQTPTVQAEIHRGDYILRYDTIVTEQALQTIRQINGITVDVSVPQLIAQVLFLAIVLYVALHFLTAFIERKYRVLTYTLIFMIGLLVVLVVTYLCIFYFQQVGDSVNQMVPFLFLPLLMCLLTSQKRVGFVAGAVFACLTLFFPTTGLMTFFYFLCSIEVSLLLVRFGVTRLDMIYQAFYSALANVLITLVFHFIEGRELIHLFTEIVGVSVNVVLTYVLLTVLLPVLERFMNIPTVFRLNELASTTSPVLVRLRTQAIGTYNHSMNVSDMAYNAAREIGANSELAKVGGLYHDIGKAEHPEYFIENQGGGPNIHDEMKYTLSAAVIKSHVKLGVEKGKEAGLPQEVLDIIEQHHGNDVISFFYNKALEEAKASKTPVQVNEEDFRYTSDIPQTKEAGIVMLADCFEAASRTLKKPTTQRYEKLFTSILVGKMNANQLDECKLSMSDIEKIKRVFVHQAFGRDHMRIQYPGKEND